MKQYVNRCVACGGNISFLDRLAELEHEQWQEWRRDIESRFKLPKSKWLNVAWDDLPEEQKNEDRRFAKKVLNIMFEELGLYEMVK